MSMFERYLDGQASIGDLLFQLLLQANENTAAIEQAANSFRSYPIKEDPNLAVHSPGLSSYSNFPELIQGIHEMNLRARDAIGILQNCAPPRLGPDDEASIRNAAQTPKTQTGEQESVRDRARRTGRLNRS